MEEEKKHSEIGLAELWNIFKRCWWLMLIVIVIVASSVYIALNVTHKDQYTATITIWAMRMPDGKGTVSTQDVSIATYLINDYMLLIKSDKIVDDVIRAQNLANVSVKQLSSMASVKNEMGTRVMYLSVTTGSPKSAQMIANTWGTIFCDYINETMGEDMVKQVVDASLPKAPSNPISLLRVLLIAFVAGFAVYGLYFVRFILDDKISSPDDVEKHLGLNVLGSIPDKNSLRRRRNKEEYYYNYGSSYGYGRGRGARKS
ncbi:MAG: hypothetical protein IKJ35_08435 [Clostridia bacterium]|nr:hypothetical protein [Clostridia bacterium]